MVIGYVRVSTDRQSYNRQLDILKKAGVDERNIYAEKESGRKRNRPELEKMLLELKQGDVVVVAELSRIGRSISDMIEILKKITEKGAFMKSIKESWLNTTDEDPYGQFLVTITMGLAQLEVDITRSRIKEGLLSARARGRVGGRPTKNEEITNAVKLYYTTDFSVTLICQMCNVGKSTLYKRVSQIRTGIQNKIAEGISDEEIAEIYKDYSITQKYIDAYRNGLNRKGEKKSGD